MYQFSKQEDKKAKAMQHGKCHGKWRVDGAGVSYLGNLVITLSLLGSYLDSITSNVFVIKWGEKLRH